VRIEAIEMAKESGNRTMPQDLGTAATIPVAEPPRPRQTASDHGKRVAALPGLVVQAPVAHHDFQDLPPSILDRFDDLHFLGRGGMGTVYRGFDKQLAREVAIKFVHGHDAAKFLREARAQARITHDNVCKIYDVGFADGQPYITMQLVRGDSLSVVSKEMTLEEKIKVIREAASALHEAHRLGLVHRDVKPGNILVERTEDKTWRPFVMDFGLARIVGEVGETMTGNVAGTPAYMAPEQARGEIRSLDRRTDVYSLGATFYDILAGHPPFVDDHPWKLLMRIDTEDAPALRSVSKNVPLDLETIVMKCLEREPDRRYDSARAFGEDLQRYLDGEPVLARKSSVLYRLAKRARKHKWLVSLAAAAIIIAVALVFVGFRARRMAAEEARIAQELGEDVKEMQLFMRYAYGLPTHDIERERAVVRKRLADIEAKMVAAGTTGRGAGHYAIGRGHLALQETEKALEHLKAAEAAGYASPELEYALGRALVEIYREKMDEVRRIADLKKQAVKQAEVDAAYKAPALAHLRKASGSRLEHPAFVEGLIALTEERYEDALRLAKRAQDEAPWFYEAIVLEAEAHYAMGAKFKHDAEFDYHKMTAFFTPALNAYRRAAAIASSDPTVNEGVCKLLVQWIYADSVIGTDAIAKVHFEEGKEAGERAINSNPKRASAYFYHAWVHVAYHSGFVSEPDLVERMRETKELAERAASMQPESALAQWLAGTASRGLNWFLLTRGADEKPIRERMIEALEKAMALDANFLWPVRELGDSYRVMGHYKRRRGIDPMPDLRRAEQLFDRADVIAPGAPSVFGDRYVVKMVIGLSLFERGLDPTPTLDEAQRMCGEDFDRAPDNILTRCRCSAIAFYQTDVALAIGNDPLPFVKRQLELTGTVNTPPSSHFHANHALGYASAARVSWARGENPVADATRAIEIYKVAPMELLSIQKPILTLLDWHVTKKSATATLFRDMLDLYVPLTKGNHGEPLVPWTIAAIHAYHAEWLVDNQKDATDALTKGFDFVAKTLEINPHFPPAFATRGDLYVTQARAAKSAKERTESARLAKESFDEALRLNKYLARETETARKEVDRLLQKP